MTETKSNGLGSFALPAASQMPPGSVQSLMLPQPRVDLAVLDARRIELTNVPPKPVPVLSLAGQQICTAGNLTVIAAQAKAGKTAVVGAVVASTIPAELQLSHPVQRDQLGFTGEPAKGKAVILFDTEQSPYDAWTLVSRAARRAGIPTLPGNYRCYSLVDVGTLTRRGFLGAEMERAKKECDGIHLVIIDGIADLCNDPNNPEEAFGLVDELVQLAVKYNCPVIVVLHENPSGADTGKTRGHLGSQLERKAESNLRVAKDGKGVSTIYADRCRRASIPKEAGPRFAYDTGKDMHMSVPTSAKEDRANAKQERHRGEAVVVFEGDQRLKYSEIKKRMIERLSLKDRTAERWITNWTDLGLITRASNGEYHLA